MKKIKEFIKNEWQGLSQGDKKLHLWFGGFISLVFTDIFRQELILHIIFASIAGIIFAFLGGCFKEWLDKRKGGIWDWADVRATVYGGVGGAFARAILINHKFYYLISKT